MWGFGVRVEGLGFRVYKGSGARVHSRVHVRAPRRFRI